MRDLADWRTLRPVQKRFGLVAVVGSGVAVVSFLAYGLLGDWGRINVDELGGVGSSARANALVLSGTAVLVALAVTVVAVLSWAIVSLRLRRERPAGRRGC